MHGHFKGGLNRNFCELMWSTRIPVRLDWVVNGEKTPIFAVRARGESKGRKKMDSARENVQNRLFSGKMGLTG